MDLPNIATMLLQIQRHGRPQINNTLRAHGKHYAFFQIPSILKSFDIMILLQRWHHRLDSKVTATRGVE